MKNKADPPRNYVVIAAIARRGGAGVHEKTIKAERRQSKIKLQQALKSIVSQACNNQMGFCRNIHPIIACTSTFQPLMPL